MRSLPKMFGLRSVMLEPEYSRKREQQRREILRKEVLRASDTPKRPFLYAFLNKDKIEYEAKWDAYMIEVEKRGDIVLGSGYPVRYGERTLLDVLLFVTTCSVPITLIICVLLHSTGRI